MIDDMNYHDDLAAWIALHSQPDDGWLVIMVDNRGNWHLFGQHYKSIRGRFTSKATHPFMGIHERNLRIYVNPEFQPGWVMDQLRSLLTSKFSTQSVYPLQTVVQA